MKKRALILTVYMSISITAPVWAWQAKSVPGVPWHRGAQPTRPMDRDQVRAAVTGLAAPKSDRHVVVQFDAAQSRADRAALAAAGVRLLSYLGNHAYFAALDGKADAGVLANRAALIDIRAIERAWKLHPLILDNRMPDHAVVDAQEDPIVAANVVFHRDVALDGAATATARRHQAVVVSRLKSLNVLVIELPLSRLTALADEDVVQWIEPPLPLLSDMNDSNRIITQTDQVQAAPYNLDGAGISVMVFDSGVGLASHTDFSGRLTVRDNDSLSNHSTHVAGTVGGDGSQSGGTFRGMAPAVTIESYGFSTNGQDIFLYSNPGDIEVDYGDAINNFAVDISNNSIGTNTCINGFPCDITGDYGVTSALIDAIVGGSLGRPFRIVWANGNERNCGNCTNQGGADSLGYHSTAPPACAKNHITVGALNSNDDSVTGFTSWGPTDDGRLKPDISGPGCQSDGDQAVTSTSSGGAYSTACGTSMAAPTVTGMSALLLEDFRAQFPDLTDPWNSTLKILLAHNAQDIGNTGPDYQSGYGSVRIRDTIDHTRTGQFLEGEINHGESFVLQVPVSAGAGELKVTLAWDDAPGTPNVSPALVNDLDLEVISPGAVQHFPWTLNPASPSNPAVQTVADHTNNIEQVVVAAPQQGTWEIRVTGFNVPEGPQRFSVTASPTMRALDITLPNGTPELLAFQTSTEIDVHIRTIGETIVGGSPTLHYRFGAGPFQTAPLSPLGGDLYRATLPPAPCDDTAEFYFSAQGSALGTVSNPISAPTFVYSGVAGEEIVAVVDDFEIDQGWTVTNDPGLADGSWTRGVPVDCDRGDPPTDFDGSGQCWLTDNSAANGCNSDVDDGATTLTSAVYDATGLSDPQFRYARWYSNTEGDSPEADIFEVEISNGGPWVNVETVGPSGPDVGGGWRVHSFRVSDFVVPTATTQLRFRASDLGAGSVVEAAIDDLSLFGLECQDEPCVAPCDDGNPCTINDTCITAFVCAGTPVDCSGASDQCNTASCSTAGAVGNCDVLTPVANGTACDDGDACNVGESCQAGACSGGATPDCSAGNTQCTTVSCDPGGAEGNCDGVNNVTNGTPCDDADPCNVGEVCSNGACAGGSPPDCGGAGDCLTASCDGNGAEGNCDTTAEINQGLPCNAGAGTCDAGVCVETRVFMSADGSQDAQPQTGSTTMVMGQGSTRTVTVWIDDASALGDHLNAYQLIIGDTATPLGGATGTVVYDDVPAPPGDGDSIFLDSGRSDWIFADEIVALAPTYNETPGTGIFGLFYSTLPGSFVDPATYAGPRYLAEFRMTASQDALGDFEINFITSGTPPFASTFDEVGAEFITHQYQPLVITVTELTCENLGDCADLDGDDIRDDNCLWWECVTGNCMSTDIVFADMGGQFGACPPDGTADGNDRFHALNCFEDANPAGGPGYPCEDLPPTAFNVDAGGQFGSCDPDGVCDGNDAFLALNAFEGATSCSCPLDGGPSPTVDPVVVDRTTLSLTAPRSAVPDDVVAVRVFSDEPITDLRGYQLHLDATGGRAGRLELIDVVIEPLKSRAFADEDPWTAFNVRIGQMIAGLDGPGVRTAAGAYLATFVYRVSTDAAGVFVVDVLHDDTRKDERTFLFATPATGKIDIDAVTPAVIEVGRRTR